MLKYIDSNIFIYSFLNQGLEKQMICSNLIDNIISKGELSISGLTIQEILYVLAKHSVNRNVIKGYYDKLKSFVNHSISKEVFDDAILLCFKLNYFQNINDCIHIKFAERHCTRIFTFDKDFEKFKLHTKLEIEILR